MKKIVLFCLFCTTHIGLALDGSVQIQAESIYDRYREKYIDGRGTNEQLLRLRKIQTILSLNLRQESLSDTRQSMYRYLRHLFCESASIIHGVTCQDGYRAPDDLTQEIKTMSLTRIRILLTKEHNQRRIQRGLEPLTESETLNTIAQTYAKALCRAGYISHELDGSKLEERYEAGNYNYRLGGENLGSGQTTIVQLLDQLTTSLHHRENMYEPEFREIGIGQCRDIWVINYGTLAE